MTPTRRRAAALGLAVLATLSLASCGSGAGGAPAPPTASAAAPGAYPVTITNCGRTATYTAAPKRVLVGWPTTVDTLTALGLGSSVTGYIAGSFGPTPQGVTATAVSTDYVPSAEAILGAQPDFFLANGDSQLSGSRGGVTPEELGKIGANSYVMGSNCKDFTGASTLDTVYQDITNLGHIFDVPDKAATLIGSLRQRVAAAAALRGNAAPPRIAYVNVAAGKLYALSGLSYAAQIEGIGGTNVFADLPETFGEISPEKVLTLDADAIVYEYYLNTETDAAQRAQILQVLGNSAAARAGKLVGVPDNLSEGPGIAVVQATELIATALYR